MILKNNKRWFLIPVVAVLIASLLLTYSFFNVRVGGNGLLSVSIAKAGDTKVADWLQNPTYKEPVTTKIENNKYEINYSGEVVSVGKGTNTFVPEITMYRWDKECYMTLGEPTINGNVLSQKNAGSTITGDTIQWASKDIEFKFYPKSQDNQSDFGSFEYEIILANSKAGTNQILSSISFPLNSSGLVFYYQPPLTQNEIDEGAVRPDNVVGSYAVYHSTKSNHIEGQVNYGTGKAFHIYRPMLTDKNGDTVWADLNISGGILTIDFSKIQDWLNKAKYPVVIDPTFGFGGIGGSTQYSTSKDLYLTQFTTGVAGTGVSISKYTDNDPVDFATKFCIYEDSGANAPSAYVAESNITAHQPDLSAWVTENLTTSPSLSASTLYWLGCFGNTGMPTYKYDTGATTFYKETNLYPNLPKPAGTGYTSVDRKISIYCTYTAAGAPDIIVSPTSYNFTIVSASSTPYTATNYFTITNNSTIQTDQTISVTTANWTGGVQWVHSNNATAGVNQAGLKANKGGDWGVGDVIVQSSVTGTPQYIYENCPASTNYTFGLKLITPTSFTDGIEKQIVVRITAVSG